MRQRWSDLLFLHWPIDPAQIQARLPKGLHVDLFEGRAWIGVVPFSMERVHPIGLPPMPWLSWFLELNVRTYVHDDEGRPGVWFFSLDCNQPVAVEVARRFFHLPYNHAKMSATTKDGEIFFAANAKNPKPPRDSATDSRSNPNLPARGRSNGFLWNDTFFLQTTAQDEFGLGACMTHPIASSLQIASSGHPSRLWKIDLLNPAAHRTQCSWPNQWM